MPSYTHTVSATTRGVIDTEDLWNELNPGNDVLIKRVSVSIETPASDARLIVRLLRTTATGTGTPVAGTEVSKDPGMRGTGVVVLEKNGTVNFIPGAVGDIFHVEAVNGRAIWTWVPRGPEEMIRVQAASFFAVGIECDLVSIIVRSTVEWED